MLRRESAVNLKRVLKPILWHRLARYVRYYGYPIPFLGRHYISGTVAKFKKLVPENAICLDLGAGVSPYRSIIERCFIIDSYVAFDIAPSNTTTLVGDAEALPLKTSSIGLVVSMDTLQHIPNVDYVFDEIGRVLAPGGMVILSYPFTYGECDVLDFHRWSMRGMQHELTRRGLEILDSRRRGGALFAVACELLWALQHIIPGGRSSWRSAVTPVVVLRSLATQLIVLPAVMLCWVALFIDAIIPAGGLYMGALIVARAPQR